jgi:hypothetical protein
VTTVLQRPEPRSPEQVYLALILDTLERIEASVARIVASQGSSSKSGGVATAKTPATRRRSARKAQESAPAETEA